jgi:MOSC domain-containing protein YiiM
MQVGTPQRYGTRGARDVMKRAWQTSFVRTPSAEPRWLYTTQDFSAPWGNRSLCWREGNVQADTKNHGRPDQAVLLYAAAHYPVWQAELGRPPLPPPVRLVLGGSPPQGGQGGLPEIGPGGFGENLTIDGLSEDTACVGDTYAIGDAQIQVTGPRYPCWKIERRWGIAGLTARVAATGRLPRTLGEWLVMLWGWYCRVLREGMLAPGLPVLLVERPYPAWTIALVNDLGHDRAADGEVARDLAACPLLNDFWRRLVARHATATAQ